MNKAKILSLIKPYIDKKLLKLAVGFYSVFTLFSILKMIYFKSIGERFGDFTWSYWFFETYFVDYIVVIVFMSITLVITNYLVVKKIKLLYVVMIHIILSVLLGVSIFFALFFVQTQTGSISKDLSFEVIFHYYMNVVDLNFLVYFSLVVITHVYINQKEIKRIKLNESQLREHLLNTKLQVLKSQIQPHFLFNTLNNICSLIDIDKEKSKSMLFDLSDLLRELVEYRNENLWEIKEEFSVINKYLNIIKIRFSDDIKIIYEIDENVKNALVPSMMIQILIENSIKHGYSINNQKLTIHIIVKKEKEELKITVKNNGKKIEEPIQNNINSGSGLKNLIERLKILYMEDYSFSMSNSNEEVVVLIKIPLVSSSY